jgi:secretion/DNA translocation related TadE-like protein
VNRGPGPRAPARSHRRLLGAVGDDGGAGSVTVLVTIVLTLALLGVTILVGGAATSAARANVAADLAALAAADAERGLVAADSCALARQTADRHGNTLSECTLEGGGTVRVRTRQQTALPWSATGESRAGAPRANDPIPRPGRSP